MNKNNNEAPKIIAGTLITAILIGAGLLLISSFLFPKYLVVVQATPILKMIPASTSTQTPPPGITPMQTQGIPSSGGFSLNDYVQITGTGTEGLRFRAAPSKSSDTLFIALESEVFKIQNGPKTADGYTWWYLVAPYDQNRSGWVVADYLTIINTPSP